jgi:hypothetical protein
MQESSLGQSERQTYSEDLRHMHFTLRLLTEG